MFSLFKKKECSECLANSSKLRAMKTSLDNAREYRVLTEFQNEECLKEVKDLKTEILILADNSVDDQEKIKEMAASLRASIRPISTDLTQRLPRFNKPVIGYFKDGFDVMVRSRSERHDYVWYGSTDTSGNPTKYTKEEVTHWVAPLIKKKGEQV